MFPNTKQDIVEETPTLRSIKIGSLSAPPPLSRSFASPLKLQQPTFSVKQPTNNSPGCKWSVDEHLPALPADYVLARSNVYVQDSSSQEVADRISNSLKCESIAAKASEDNKNSLNAESNQGLRFAVNLFADDASVVVEVQRLSGCSFEFREKCKVLCRSAKGLGGASQKRKFKIPSCIPRESAEEQAKRCKVGLETALSLIKSDRMDSQLMGLESLEKLSMNSALTSTIMSGEYLDILIEKSENISESFSDLREKHDTLMRRRALTVLANGLSSCKVVPEELTQESFVRRLLESLRNSCEEPHEACQAARCLQALTSTNESMQTLLHNLHAESILSSIESNHMALEQESFKLKMVLTR